MHAPQRGQLQVRYTRRHTNTSIHFSAAVHCYEGHAPMRASTAMPCVIAFWTKRPATEHGAGFTYGTVLLASRSACHCVLIAHRGLHGLGSIGRIALATTSAGPLQAIAAGTHQAACSAYNAAIAQSKPLCLPSRPPGHLNLLCHTPPPPSLTTTTTNWQISIASVHGLKPDHLICNWPGTP